LDQRFDVVVIGGGPAGSAAAHIMSGTGMNVAVIDKAIFPRNKLCGGLLTERSQAVFKSIFGEGWEPAIEAVSDSIAFYYRDRFLNQLDSYRRIYFTSRPNYDTFLLELAAKKGARVFQGRIVSSIDLQNRAIILADGQKIQADFIIGADGVNSRVSKLIAGSRDRRRALAFGLECEIPRDLLKRSVQSPEIYLGVARWGYGWVFPKKNSVTVGLAGLLNSNSSLRSNFEQFLRQICGFLPGIPYEGHHIPFGYYLNMPGRAATLLVGDAAGLVEPVTGEGIAFAMLSGRYAGEAVVQAAEQGDPNAALDFYLVGYRKITSLLKQAKWMRYLLFPEISQKLLVKALPHSQSIMKKYMDLIAGDIDYVDYLSHIFKRLIRNPFLLVKLAR
jgi:geranylgeranyl reductase family protein